MLATIANSTSCSTRIRMMSAIAIRLAAHRLHHVDDALDMGEALGG
jgi:hypothetical protein